MSEKNRLELFPSVNAIGKAGIGGYRHLKDPSIPCCVSTKKIAHVFGCVPEVTLRAHRKLIYAPNFSRRITVKKNSFGTVSKQIPECQCNREGGEEIGTQRSSPTLVLQGAQP